MPSRAVVRARGARDAVSRSVERAVLLALPTDPVAGVGVTGSELRRQHRDAAGGADRSALVVHAPSIPARARLREVSRLDRVAQEAPIVALRPVREDEADVVADIWWRGWPDGHAGHVPQELADARTRETFRGRARERLARTTVVTVDGVIAGFVAVARDEVEQVYVAAPYRGMGVAATLLREAERQVAANGYDTAWLAVVPGNARARAFYAREGWLDEGELTYESEVPGGSMAVSCRRYTRAV
jgi:ribosomal protein S18 acetylase RimI-like enzyme